MKYRCPNCDGIGSIQGYDANHVAEDSEMYIVKCKTCKKSTLLHLLFPRHQLKILRI